MNVYFSASIAGGRKYLDIYQEMVAFIKELGHHVLSEHVIRPDVFDLEENHSAEDIYTRDVKWIKSCDAMIAEVSNPSLGVGYEICYALCLGKPVLSLFQKGLFISRMIVGNTSPGFHLVEYAASEKWKKAIPKFLNS